MELLEGLNELTYKRPLDVYLAFCKDSINISQLCYDLFSHFF